MIGDPDKARRYMNQATEYAPGNPYVHYYDALLKSRSEDHDAAIDALSIAIVNGYPRVMLIAEPHLRGIRESERFKALVTLPSNEKHGSQESNQDI